jgi:hypothetical protein
MLETSKRLVDQPKTATALRAGELSAAQAEVVSRAVAVAPGAEGELLELAKNAPIGRLKRRALCAKAAVDGDARYDRIRKERSAREYVDDEGVWHFHAKGTVDDGAKFRAAWEPITDRIFKEAYAAGRREPREAYAFDAFMELIDRPADTAGSSRKYLGLVRVDLEAMRRGYVEGEEVCEISGLGPIPHPERATCSVTPS